MLSWKGPKKIIKSNSWLNKGPRKIQALCLRAMSKYSLNFSHLIYVELEPVKQMCPQTVKDWLQEQKRKSAL